MLAFYDTDVIAPSCASMRMSRTKFILGDDGKYVIPGVDGFSVDLSKKLPVFEFDGRIEDTTDLIILAQCLLLGLYKAESFNTIIFQWTTEEVERKGAYSWYIREGGHTAAVNLSLTVEIATEAFDIDGEVILSYYKSDANAEQFDKIYEKIKRLFQLVGEKTAEFFIKEEVVKEFKRMLRDEDLETVKTSVALSGAFYGKGEREFTDEEKVELREKYTKIGINRSIQEGVYKLGVEVTLKELATLGVDKEELYKLGEELYNARVY